MTQPAELYSEPIGGATTPVELAGDAGRDLFYVKSPVTGDTRGVTREQAVELISRAGWEPVVEPVAQNLLQRQLLRESSSPYAAALYGGIRGLTGGLSEYGLPQGSEPGAMAVQALREEHPGAALGGEIAGNVAPFLVPGMKLLSLPGMAEAGGSAATRALAGNAPGIARSIAARALGMGLEGGLQGMAYNAGESAIEDTPLTAQKLGAGFLYGATPGAILGAPLGATEGILGRYALKGGLVRERILKPGITDQDAMQIAQREFGVAAPGLMDELNANMSGESAELHKLASDPSPIGQDIRRQLMEAPERKKEALARAAANLNEIRDLDEVAINGIAGRMKAEQVRKWIPSGEVAQVDADALLMDAVRADTPDDFGNVAAREAATVAPGNRASAEEATRRIGAEVTQKIDDADVAKLMPRPSKDAIAERGRIANSYEPTPGQADAVRAYSFGYDDAMRKIQQGVPDEEIIAAREREYGGPANKAGETHEEHVRRAHELLPELESYLANAPVAKDQPFVYRGIVTDEAGYQRALRDDNFNFGAISSASYDPQVARSFVGRALDDANPQASHGVLYRIKHASGVGAGDSAATRVRIEREIMLPRDAEFRVVRRFRDPSNPSVLIVDAEEIAPTVEQRLARNRDIAHARVAEHNRDFVAQGYEVPPEAPAYARMREEQAARIARDAEVEAARVAELNAKASPRGKRIAKMSDILSRWAEFDAPDAGNVMRNELGAMPGRQRLRERLNYVLGNGGEEGIAAYRKAMAAASEADQMALNKRLLDAGFSPSVAKPWKGAAVGVLDQLGEEVDAMLGNAKGVIGKKAGGAGDIRDLLLHARSKVLSGDKAQAFIELDYLKKRLGKLAAPGEYLGSDMNVAAMARRQYEDIREMLENPQLWGQKAALAQKDINRIMTQRINRADVFFDKFFVDSGEAHPNNPWVRLREATPDSVGKQLDGIINPGDSREYQAFRQHISESRDVLQNLKQHYALSDAERGAIGRWGKAIDDAEESFKDAVFHSQREAQAAKLFKNQARVIPGWGKWVAGHFLGPAGFFGVAAAEQALNPGGRIYARAVLERTLRQSDSRLASAITKILTGKRIRLEGIGATQLVSKGAVSAFSGKDKKKAYAETVKELAKFSDPQLATQHASQAMPFATQTLPNFAATMGAQTAKASQYLLQHAPVQPRWTPQGIVVDQPSDMELHEFEARMRGAFDPASVFDDVAEGEPVPDVQIEAAEYVAPELMDHARLLLMSAMADGSVKLSYAKTVQLSMVMGTSLDPTMDPGYINAQQSMYAASAQSAPMKSRRTGNPDGVNRGYRSLHQSKDDQIEAGVPPT